MHMDLNASGGHDIEDERRRRVDAEVARLKALGATDERGSIEKRGEYWVRMNDPRAMSSASSDVRVPVAPARSYGAQGMVAPLREALVQRPGEAFGRAFEDPAYGFLHPVDLQRAQAEHDGTAATLRGLGVVVDEQALRRKTQTSSIPSTPRWSPIAASSCSDREATGGEETFHAAWYKANGIPVIGAIEAPGTVDGGDTFWIDARDTLHRPDTPHQPIRRGQLAAIWGGDVRFFDVPYGDGPERLIHLLSVVSPVDDDLAVVHLPLPSGSGGRCGNEAWP